MNKKVKKVIIPAAGFGTRFLPQTKAMPKEMLPIVDKPVIQHIVEEVVDAGIEDVIIVTGWNKRTIEDHFDYPFELITKLEQAGEKKRKMLDEVKRSADLANFIYIRQKGPNGVMGNAIPLWNARDIIGDEPFMVMWGDDFTISETKSRAKQLIEAYEKYGTSVLSAMRRSDEAAANQFAYAGGEMVDEGVCKVETIIEKPGLDKMPSDMAVFSGYIFTPEFFDAVDYLLENNITGPGGEYVYTDALERMIKTGSDVHAIELKDSTYYDTGNKFQYMRTVTEFALMHPDIGDEYREYLKNLEL